MDELHLQLHSKIDEIAQRYSGQQQIDARGNMYMLLGHKTQGRLNDDVNSYNKYNTLKAIELIDKVEQIDKDILINSDKMAEFVEDPAYTSFEWKI